MSVYDLSSCDPQCCSACTYLNCCTPTVKCLAIPNSSSGAPPPLYTLNSGLTPACLQLVANGFLGACASLNGTWILGNWGCARGGVNPNGSELYAWSGAWSCDGNWVGGNVLWNVTANGRGPALATASVSS